MTEILALNIKQRRKQLGLKQEELAKLAGCAQAAVSNLETGRRDASIKFLVRLATALQMPIGMLFVAPTDQE